MPIHNPPTGTVAPGGQHFPDDVVLSFGNTDAAPNVSVLYETADANANALLFAMPTGGATDVPVAIFGDATALNLDLGLFDGITDPTVAVLSDDATDAIFFYHNGTDGKIDVISGDVDILTNLSVSGEITSATADTGTASYDSVKNTHNIANTAADHTGTSTGLQYFVFDVLATQNHTGQITGVNGNVQLTQGVTRGFVYGVRGALQITGGTASIAAGVSSSINIGAGTTVSSAAGLHSPAFSGTGGASTAYGLLVDPPGKGTTQWTAAIGSGNSYVAGNLSVGGSNVPTVELDVAGQGLFTAINTATTGTISLLDNDFTVTPTGDGDGIYISNRSTAVVIDTVATSMTGRVTAYGGTAQLFDAGVTLAELSGGDFGATVSAGTATAAYAVKGVVSVAAGTATTAASVYAAPYGSVAGTITTGYGLLVDPPGGVSGTEWTMGVTGSGNSYIDGLLSVGKATAPTVELDIAGDVLITQDVQTSGSPNAFKLNAAAHTSLDAGVPFPDVWFNLSRTVQFDAGNLQGQTGVLISPATYGFTGASDLTASTFMVGGAPIMGTNVTLANSTAITAQIGSITGNQNAAGSTYSLTVSPEGITDGTGAAGERYGIIVGTNSDLDMGDQTNTLDTLSGLVFFGGTPATSAGTRTITETNIIEVQNAYSEGSGVSIPTANVIKIGGAPSFASKAAQMYSGINLEDQTITLTGNTQITGTPSFAGVRLGTTTLSDTVALTVDAAATLYIKDAIAGGGAGPVTITNTYSLWVDAGLSRFDGDGTDVFELPADATDPTGGGGAAAGRIPVKIGGATRYIAYY